MLPVARVRFPAGRCVATHVAPLATSGECPVRPSVLTCLAVLALVACTGEPVPPEEVDADLVIVAEDPFEFVPDEATADAGEITVGLVNHGEVRHTLTFENREGDLKLNTGRGDADTGSITFDPGTYTFYCDVPGHRGAGMEGTLTVQ